MKKLTEMNNRELFSILTGADVIQQAYLQKIVRLHLDYVHKNNIKEDCDLMTMVREYMDGVYGEIKE
jgi:hypothetical protein